MLENELIFGSFALSVVALISVVSPFFIMALIVSGIGVVKQLTTKGV